MINSLKELRVKLSSDDLIKYYFESLNKTPEQILSLLKSNGIDATIECANECHEFCKKVIAIEEKELDKDWWVFEKGTDKYYIWDYFDEKHSKGVAYLLGVS